MEKIHKLVKSKNFIENVIFVLVILLFIGVIAGGGMAINKSVKELEKEHATLLEKDFLMGLGDSFYMDNLTLTGIKKDSLLFERNGGFDKYTVPAKENTTFTLSNDIERYTFYIVEIRKETNSILLRISKEDKKSKDN